MRDRSADQRAQGPAWPRTPRVEYAGHDDPAGVPLPANWHDDFVGKPALSKRGADLRADLSKEQVRAAIARYWASCERVNARVGRVLEAPDRSGQPVDMPVVFTADHDDL